jgi:hypothetical protein
MRIKAFFAPFQLIFEKAWQVIFKIALFLSLYLSAFLYWSVRSRSLGFLIGVNPGIRLGGTVGYSKFGVLRRLPVDKTPRSVLLWKAVSPGEVEDMMHRAGLRFPVILKPDTGMQSMGVRKIGSSNELKMYLLCMQRNLILQEFIQTEAEFAVLYYRLPGQVRGNIFSFSQRIRKPNGLAGAECLSLNHLISTLAGTTCWPIMWGIWKRAIFGWLSSTERTLCHCTSTTRSCHSPNGCASSRPTGVSSTPFRAKTKPTGN